MKISDTMELLASMPLDIDRLAAAQGEPYRTMVVKAEDLRASPAELVEEMLLRYGAPLKEDGGNIRRYREAQDLARGLAGLCAQLKRYEEAATIAAWFAEVHDTRFEMFLIGAEAAAHAGRFDDAAELLGVALRKSFLDNFRDAGHYLKTFVKRCPRAKKALDGCSASEWIRILRGRKPPRKADLRGEACQIEQLWSDDRISLPDQVRPVLFRFTREEALGLLEAPPLNPLEYWFSRDFEDRTKFPHPEAGAQLLQLLEVLVGCGHAAWLAGELPRRAPRVAIVAALSGHPLLVAAAAETLHAPGLASALDLVRAKRVKVAEHLEIARFGETHPRFLAALADAIRVYNLTNDRLDTLVQPIELFPGLDRANPGKLVYFFVQKPEAYPLFAAFIEHWGAGGRDPRTFFFHPRGGMLYTKAYHYRAAALACCFTEGPDGLGELRAILENLDDEVHFIQSGRTLGFRNDTRRIVAATLHRLGKTELLGELSELLAPVEDEG